MPITLNPVSGLIDATIVEDNFTELETFFKENITKSDFRGKFDKYNIRRYTSGKITSFNSGTRAFGNERTADMDGTFENNWLSGTNEGYFLQKAFDRYEDFYHDHVKTGPTDSYNKKFRVDPLHHPFELLGYPGGSLYYDFQEQGFASPDEYYAANGSSCSNWPPSNSALNKFPQDECWSRWLTVPQSAGSVYVDEPCVAIITANVMGNYFFTPAMRVHGINCSDNVSSDYFEPHGGDGTKINALAWGSHFQKRSSQGVFHEGMQHSAHLRMGLFVDTNPIVWEDEFRNGDAYGNPFTQGSGHGFNPWIGSDPGGKYETDRPDGVSKSRSWIKVNDLSVRVRQRHCYKIIGAVNLKGRRRYNFSLKFRPAMTFGYVGNDDGSPKFREYYAELSHWNFSKYWDLVTSGGPTGVRERWNPAWHWSSSTRDRGPGTAYHYPGGDILATNLIESSSLGVEFFYGNQISREITGSEGLMSGWDPFDPEG